jgi:hypothetical protein
MEAKDKLVKLILCLLDSRMIHTLNIDISSMSPSFCISSSTASHFALCRC